MNVWHESFINILGVVILGGEHNYILTDPTQLCC